MNIDQSEHIARLIYHHIVGDISAEAQKELDKWLRENERNEKVYGRLLNTDFLKRECNKLRAIDPQRAMEAMQARIHDASSEGRSGRSYHLRTIALTMISTAAMLLMLFGLYFYWDKADGHAPKMQVA
ncbi:MAG: hypothetical protein MR450_09755 [Prevotella sp.]|nr:hypothetical protein [Prevotella sp.]MDY4039926.1 hypothetical protein [Prevotella sp.]